MINLDYVVAWSGTALPLSIAATGELVGQRGGIVNLGIEANMLVGGLLAWLAFHHGAGFVGALAVSAAAALLSGVAFWIAIDVLEVAQQLAGLAAFFSISGITMLVFRQTALTAPANPIPHYELFDLAIPFLTGLFLLAPVGLNVWFGHSRLGVALTLIGRDSRSADLLGIPVRAYRLSACVFSFLMSHLAGGVTVLLVTRDFRDGLISGRGWIVLCLVILANWNGAALAFILAVWSLIDLLAASGQIAGVQLSYHVLLAIPYLSGILALPVLLRKKNAPHMLFRPYRRNENAA